MKKIFLTICIIYSVVYSQAVSAQVPSESTLQATSSAITSKLNDNEKKNIENILVLFDTFHTRTNEITKKIKITAEEREMDKSEKKEYESDFIELQNELDLLTDIHKKTYESGLNILISQNLNASYEEFRRNTFKEIKLLKDIKMSQKNIVNKYLI
jgi:hypothetical protein